MSKYVFELALTVALNVFLPLMNTWKRRKLQRAKKTMQHYSTNMSTPHLDKLLVVLMLIRLQWNKNSHIILVDYYWFNIKFEKIIFIKNACHLHLFPSVMFLYGLLFVNPKRLEKQYLDEKVVSLLFCLVL